MYTEGDLKGQVVFGDAVIKQLAFDDGLSVTALLLILLGIMVALLFIAFIALRQLTKKK